ncbi:conserved hypothetical protein [Desulfarculus baarsii DSM 2075]|uniref:Cas10/Cmr2 second palm domain-containing protein n=1 Tax=Desulfarculus baarsii (strain ATCC 33931 / DSM 2075 / LMG 7858 / VKM B-1802 / 2st14) TaxID=644282 RepID=E1QGM6_DESB2|nr:hypothetical protein [Desulfarculus baarsii]ADK84719.1 conserved hypothetical protein [Desulfarculus baarsii DSM 2075]
MCEQKFRLVLLETSGNQAYIFAANKLREIMGASQIVHEVGTKLVCESLDAVCPGRHNLYWREQEQCVEFKDGRLFEGDCQAEVMVAASGKALILVADNGGVKDDCLANKLIRAWSLRVCRYLPGVDATGVYSAARCWSEGGAVAAANLQAHQRFEQARLRRRGPLARFQRLPVTAACVSSGGPASGFFSETPGKSTAGQGEPAAQSDKKEPLFAGSRTTLTKRQRQRYNKTRERFNQLYGPDCRLFGNLLNHDTFDKMGADWLAVIHADGNGLGQVFLNFGTHVGKIKPALKGGALNRAYVDAYREFSRGLDECAQKAFKQALLVCKALDLVKRAGDDTWRFPIFPVVLGGDDLTVVMTGELALPFCAAFLKAFEGQVAGWQQELPEDDSAVEPDAIVQYICQKALGAPRLGICAGVAIIKPHFPFHVAHDLAEELLRSAKQVKAKALGKPCSALDFHILHDSSFTSLDDLRQRLRPAPGMLLHAKPYALGAGVVAGDGADDAVAQWLACHDWERFCCAAQALQTKLPDASGVYKPILPPSQAHAVVENIWAVDKHAESAFQYGTMKRYGDFADAWRAATGDDCLFFCECEENKTTRLTYFLDALEAKGFMGGNDE